MTCRYRPPFVLPLFLSLTTICIAQTQSTPASSAESQQRRDAGLAMLREAISSSRDLVQPVNRIYIEANCIQLLWDEDEPMARSLVKSLEERYSDLNRQMAALPRNQRNLVQSAFALRRQVVSAVAAHDPALALEFLRNTRPAETGNRNEEADLELTLAAQAARQNTKLAADLVRNANAQNSGMVMQALEQLYQADPAVATQTASDLIGKLANSNLSNRQTFFSAVQLLQSYSNLPLPGTQYASRGNDPVISGYINRLGAGRSPVITSAGLQPLAQALIAAAQKPGFPPDLQQMLQNILPSLEKLSPNASATFGTAAKTNAGNNAGTPEAFWQQLNDIAAHGSVQQGIEFAKSAPEEMRYPAYDRIANKLASDGDVAGATELIQGAEIAPEQRRQLLDNVNRGAMQSAINQGLFAQARAAAANIEDPAERAGMLMQIAQNAIERKQSEVAKQLLEEARGLLPNAPSDVEEMNSLVQLASGYMLVDPSVAGEILESLVTTINQKLPALAAADGFTWGQRSFIGNEMMMQMGPAADMMRGVGNALARLAGSKPESAARIAAELQRPEARTLTYMEIAQTLFAQSRPPAQLRAGFASIMIMR